MLVVGELINASRKPIAKAIETQNEMAIQQIAADQVKHGAGYIDVNAGIFVEKEKEYLRWLVNTVQSAVDVPCCLDSPSPAAIEAALAVHHGPAMINSISLESQRFQKLIPLVSGTQARVVALCMSDQGVPESTAQRVAIADRLINGLVKNNVQIDNIYVDPLVQPVSVNNRLGVEFLHAIEVIMTRFEGVHTICGISNVSYGLPGRRFLNQIFAVMAVERGLDSIIMDPLDLRLMAAIIAAETVSGKDEFCMNYLTTHQNKRIVP